MTRVSVLPFWGRVTVMESPVDASQRPSGLIVPIRHEEIEETFRRGVILDIDHTYHSFGQWGEYAKQIDSGVVVFFTHGTKIGDLYVVEIADILAFEVER